MSKKSAHRWELFGCALHGHVFVGLDVAEIRPQDKVIVRELGGLRWYRCLRCDSWSPFSVPSQPVSETLPPHEAITLPLRGRALRDRFILRLIALDRAIHVVVLTGLAVALFVFVSHRNALQGDYNSLMNALLGSSGGPAALRGFLGKLHRFFLYNPQHLDEIGYVAIGYAVLEALEMVGLWYAKRWAEYLTFIATTLLLPLEVYELSTKISIVKIVVFVINFAIVGYLVYAKRLFGVHGGGRAEEERRREENSWSALEGSLPTPSSAAKSSMA